MNLSDSLVTMTAHVKPKYTDYTTQVTKETQSQAQQHSTCISTWAIREAGLQLPDDANMLTELDLFGPYIDNKVIKRLVVATKTC